LNESYVVDSCHQNPMPSGPRRNLVSAVFRTVQRRSSIGFGACVVSEGKVPVTGLTSLNVAAGSDTDDRRVGCSLLERSTETTDHFNVLAANTAFLVQ